MTSKTKRASAEPRWFTYESGAEYVGCSVRQLRRWAQAGRVSYTRLGLRTQFSREQLDAFIAASTVEASR